MKAPRSRPGTPSATPPSTTICFRLDAETRRVLDERAARLNLSPHDLARRYVMEVLQEAEERAALREAVTILNDHWEHFRGDFALAMEALLVSAGKVSVADARHWIEKCLHHR